MSSNGLFIERVVWGEKRLCLVSTRKAGIDQRPKLLEISATQQLISDYVSQEPGRAPNMGAGNHPVR